VNYRLLTVCKRFASLCGETIFRTVKKMLAYGNSFPKEQRTLFGTPMSDGGVTTRKERG
jgi:hypothetical protein